MHKQNIKYRNKQTSKAKQQQETNNHANDAYSECRLH